MSAGKKHCRLGGKCRLENFPCHYRKCPDIPWNAGPKNSRGGKKPPRAYRGGWGGEKKNLVGPGKKMLVGKKNCWLEKKMPAVGDDRA